jgi:hypothetical protein
VERNWIGFNPVDHDMMLSSVIILQDNSTGYEVRRKWLIFYNFDVKDVKITSIKLTYNKRLLGVYPDVQLISSAIIADNEKLSENLNRRNLAMAQNKTNISGIIWDMIRKEISRKGYLYRLSVNKELRKIIVYIQAERHNLIIVMVQIDDNITVRLGITRYCDYNSTIIDGEKFSLAMANPDFNPQKIVERICETVESTKLIHRSIVDLLSQAAQEVLRKD